MQNVSGDFDSTKVLATARRYRATSSPVVLRELLDAIMEADSGGGFRVKNSLFDQAQTGENGEMSADAEQKYKTLQARLNGKDVTAKERTNICMELRKLRTGSTSLFTESDYKNRP